MAETTNNDNGRPTDSNPTRLALRPREAAAALGISERTLWSLKQRGEIPYKRAGRSVLYEIDQLRTWLARQPGGGNNP